MGKDVAHSLYGEVCKQTLHLTLLHMQINKLVLDMRAPHAQFEWIKSLFKRVQMERCRMFVFTDLIHVPESLKSDFDDNLCSDIFPNIRNSVDCIGELLPHACRSRHIDCFAFEWLSYDRAANVAWIWFALVVGPNRMCRECMASDRNLPVQHHRFDSLFAANKLDSFDKNGARSNASINLSSRDRMYVLISRRPVAIDDL